MVGWSSYLLVKYDEVLSGLILFDVVASWLWVPRNPVGRSQPDDRRFFSQEDSKRYDYLSEPIFPPTQHH